MAALYLHQSHTSCGECANSNTNMQKESNQISHVNKNGI